jgi:hypothetical protein
VLALQPLQVFHWMWPLFTERWGPWRQEVLGLQQLPLLAASQEAWQGCTFSSSSSSAELQRHLQEQQQQQLLRHRQVVFDEQLQGDSDTNAAAAAAAEPNDCGLHAARLPSSVPVLYGE